MTTSEQWTLLLLTSADIEVISGCRPLKVTLHGPPVNPGEDFEIQDSSRGNPVLIVLNLIVHVDAGPDHVPHKCITGQCFIVGYL